LPPLSAFGRHTERAGKACDGPAQRRKNRRSDTFRAYSRFVIIPKVREFFKQEYYDLRNFLENLASETTDGQTKSICQRANEIITDELIIYEKHTSDCRSNGLSIYLSNVHLPENVYQAHQQLYRRCRFSRETAWDEMIESSRRRLRKR
jgi:hypothetical protein